VSPEIGLQVQVNDGISQSLADDHNNEQNQDDVVSSNDRQDVGKWNVIHVNGTNICNQGVLEENVRITNADCSSANNNANVNPRVQQTNQTVVYVDDANSNADDDKLLTCALCIETINSDRDRGYADTDGQCQCQRNDHYNCLSQMCIGQQRKQTNMKCQECRRQVFDILDYESENKYALEEDAENVQFVMTDLVEKLNWGKWYAHALLDFITDASNRIQPISEQRDKMCDLQWHCSRDWEDY
jgi:hypothetical protein